MDIKELTGLLQWGAAISLLLAVSWVFRFKKEPARAKLMGFAFIVLAIAMIGFSLEWPIWIVGVLAGLVVATQILDFAMRAGQKAKAEEP